MDIMGIRKPFKIPTSDFFYIEIDRKRQSLKTSDKSEALRIFSAIKTEYMAGRIHAIGGTCSKNLGDFAEEFLEFSENTQPVKTFKSNRYSLNSLIDVEGKNVKLSFVSQKSIDKLISKAKARGLKATSINIQIRTLKSIFGKAEAWGYVKDNPLRKVKQITEEKRPPRYITGNEITLFLSSIIDKDIRLLAAAYLSTGRRRGELLALTWEDIDFTRNRYLVRQEKVHRVQYFPLSESFKAILAEIPKTTGKIFKRWSHPDSVSHVIKDALVGANFAHMRLHDLRHSFAVAYVEGGGSMRILQDLLGHGQLSTTEIYAHVGNDILHDAINTVCVKFA